jgi:YD repeat-containing protein
LWTPCRSAEVRHDELGIHRSNRREPPATTFEYDGLGHRTATILPLGQRSESVYDAVGNVSETIDFNGSVIQYHYDEQDRLVSKKYPDSTILQFTYTRNGLSETITDRRGVTHYEYDERDRLVFRSDPDGSRLPTLTTWQVTASLTIPGTTRYGRPLEPSDRCHRLARPSQYHFDALADWCDEYARRHDGNVSTTLWVD